ncbi:DegT/DnrJ/EryC1/StrS family aminotransferase [Patescibacteria group bacterium]
MVPFFDLTRQYKSIQGEVDLAIKSSLKRGVFILGPQVKAYEEDFADYLGIWHAVGVASGTDALSMSIWALDIKPGDEVMLPANAYPTAFGIATTGVRIRLVDCGSDGNVDLKKLEKLISTKTKAVIPVHLYGKPADVIGIKIMLNRKSPKTMIIEDAAQAHGAEVKDGSKWRKAGTIGRIGIFSFYPTKNVGAYGDGGVLVTDRASIAKKLRAMRMYGESSRYRSDFIAGVSRLDEIQAAILQVKLKFLDKWNKRRAEIAEMYSERLEGVGDLKIISNFQFSITNKNTKSKLYNNEQFKSCNHLFVIRTSKRDELKVYLEKKGVMTAIHYPVPVHMTPAFKHLGYKKGDFPEVEAQAGEVLSLPMFPELTDKEVEEVVKRIRGFYGK